MHRRVLFLVLGCAQFLSGAAQAQSTSSPASASAPQPPANGLDIRLPLESKSIRFAVIGDSGTGDRDQYQVAQEMETYRQKVGFDFVLMLGDNIYGSHHPKDFTRKFELPYKPLLDAGVKFYAVLGNDPNQLSWIDQNLQNTKSKWKICYFHHPLYNEGRSHGPDLDLRTQLTPLFKRYGVNLVLSGHEHVYERIKPQDNIYYLILGNSAKLMSKDLKSSDQMQKGFDSDRGFMLVEINGDKLYFQVISRTGQTIDAGVFDRQTQPSTSSAAAH